MDPYARFRELVTEAAQAFLKLRPQHVRVISNYDADGISAAAILLHALQQEHIPFTVSIIQQLTEGMIQEYAQESQDIFLFADLGSKHLRQMHDLMPKKKIFVLDHHELPLEHDFPNITLISPHCCDLDGGFEISAAGICFHFARAMNPKNVVMAPIGIVGAIGDVQEDQGFHTLNDDIVQLAVEQGLLEVRRGLRCFGGETRPLHKVLEYNSDPFIPGVSGSESGAIEFLHSLGIEPKRREEWKKLSDLTQQEMENLITGIVLRRLHNGENDPEDILGFVYTLLQEEPGTPFRDAKEFATLLNACGRMDKAALGLGTCLGDPTAKRKAAAHLIQYKKAIVNAMNWFRDHRGTPAVIEEDGYVLVNAGENFISSIIGTMLSIVSKSGEYPDGTFLLGMARASEKITKVSIRVAGIKRPENIALHEIVNEIVAIAGGEAGGHAAAAGAMIPVEKEGEFIRVAKEVLQHRLAQPTASKI